MNTRHSRPEQNGEDGLDPNPVFRHKPFDLQDGKIVSLHCIPIHPSALRSGNPDMREDSEDIADEVIAEETQKLRDAFSTYQDAIRAYTQREPEGDESATHEAETSVEQCRANIQNVVMDICWLLESVLHAQDERATTILEIIDELQKDNFKIPDMGEMR